MTTQGGAALVIGVGASAGVGAAVAQRLAKEGLDVAIMGRTADRVRAVAAEIATAGGKARTIVGDATVHADVARAFRTAEEAGPIDVAVFNAGGNRPRPLLETDPAFFEEMWRVGCFAGHLFALEAARHMLPRGQGTVLFTGASASLRGRAGFEAFASAKAGLRAVPLAYISSTPPNAQSGPSIDRWLSSICGKLTCALWKLDAL